MAITKEQRAKIKSMVAMTKEQREVYGAEIKSINLKLGEAILALRHEFATITDWKQLGRASVMVRLAHAFEVSDDDVTHKVLATIQQELFAIGEWPLPKAVVLARLVAAIQRQKLDFRRIRRNRTARNRLG